MKDKSASELLLASAIPFDVACTKVREIEREISDYKRQVSMDTECIERIRNKCYDLEAKLSRAVTTIQRIEVLLIQEAPGLARGEIDDFRISLRDAGCPAAKVGEIEE